TRSTVYRCSLPGLAGFNGVPSPGTAVKIGACASPRQPAPRIAAGRGEPKSTLLVACRSTARVGRPLDGTWPSRRCPGDMIFVMRGPGRWVAFGLASGVAAVAAWAICVPFATRSAEVGLVLRVDAAVLLFSSLLLCAAM